jgi:hypothetical protein
MQMSNFTEDTPTGQMTVDRAIEEYKMQGILKFKREHTHQR